MDLYPPNPSPQVCILEKYKTNPPAGREEKPWHL